MVLYCYSNQLSTLKVSVNTALTILWCSDNQLTSLSVSANTTLTQLHCYNNQLTELNVVSTALTSLFCSDNQLTELNVSANTALTRLWCHNNQLSTLNLSTNTALTTLWCNNNQLTSLNVANGNNSNFILTYGDNRVANSFNATGNSNLTCIQVDDVDYSTANWTNKEANASYSENCFPPTIMGATIDITGNIITIMTSELVILINVDNVDFTVTSTLNGVTRTHTVTSITSGSIILNVTPAIPAGADVSISYDPELGDNTEAITDIGGRPMLSTNITLRNDNFEIARFTIFPNPTTDILNISVKEKSEYKLLNIRGQILKKGTLATGKSKINLSSFARGIYLLNIKTSKGSFIEKIIKK